MKSLIPAAILLSCSILGLAQAPAPSAPAQEITLNEQTRREVIETALSALNKNYVFPETAKKMETAIRRRMDRGAYDRITDPRQFAQMLEAHLQEVSRDKHLLIFYRRSIFKKENTWKKLSVEVETIAPHRVKRIGIDNAEPPAKRLGRGFPARRAVKVDPPHCDTIDANDATRATTADRFAVACRRAVDPPPTVVRFF